MKKIFIILGMAAAMAACGHKGAVVVDQDTVDVDTVEVVAVDTVVE